MDEGVYLLPAWRRFIGIVARDLLYSAELRMCDTLELRGDDGGHARVWDGSP